MVLIEIVKVWGYSPLDKVVMASWKISITNLDHLGLVLAWNTSNPCHWTDGSVICNNSDNVKVNKIRGDFEV
jgi:hypothetical protein